MKLCDTHQDELNTAIEDRGLKKFIAPSTEEGHRRFKAMLSHGVSRDCYCPISLATFEICQNAVDNSDGKIAQDDHADAQHAVCPVCWLCSHTEQIGQTPEYYSSYVTRGADEALFHAKKIGLVATC